MNSISHLPLSFLHDFTYLFLFLLLLCTDFRIQRLTESLDYHHCTASHLLLLFQPTSFSKLKITACKTPITAMYLQISEKNSFRVNPLWILVVSYLCCPFIYLQHHGSIYYSGTFAYLACLTNLILWLPLLELNLILPPIVAHHLFITHTKKVQLLKILSRLMQMGYHPHPSSSNAPQVKNEPIPVKMPTGTIRNIESLWLHVKP